MPEPLRKDRVILIDIDHSISNAFWRDPMIGVEPWDAYHTSSAQDEPIYDTVRLLSALFDNGHTIIGITARPGKWRNLTMGWMLAHNIPMDELLMREDTDFRPSPELKVDLAKARFGEDIKDHVMFMIDDRDDVIAAFRALGVSCLQIFARKD